MTDLYETLRQAALGEPLSPPARSGLILFLRRGMWGWAQMIATAPARPEPISAPCSRQTPPSEPIAIVRVFAAMAMSTQDRRAP
jgi:hypothetical protein